MCTLLTCVAKDRMHLRCKHGSRIDNTAGANHKAKVTFFQLFLGSIEYLQSRERFRLIKKGVFL